MCKKSSIGNQEDATTQDEMGAFDRQDVETSSSSNSSQHPQQIWRTIFIVGALCLSVFLIALDYTIVTTAIPKIT
jgi:hypothetical protein